MSLSRFRPGLNLPAEQIDANRRYWDTEEGVNAIAEAMDVSKGRLYDLLLPLDAGVACPNCGGALGFAHRTARQRGTVTCEACGFEGSVEDLKDAEADAEAAGGDGSGGSDASRASRASDASTNEVWTSGAADRAASGSRAALGATLLGVAAGVLLVAWYRR